MKNIKISVLIYVLNDHLHIGKCIRSVMAQSLQELEILLIDGGSTDGTLEIIQKLQKEDARLRLLESEPGVGRQFNTGLKAAAGKYIGICESDDYLLPDMYERLYEIAERHELDVIKANVLRFCENDEKEYTFKFMLSTDMTIYDTLLHPQEDNRFLGLGVNGFWSGLYNRDFLMNNGLFMNETGGASYQDITFSFMTELYAKRAYVMSEAFYCYRMDNPNSSVNNPKKISLLNTEYGLLKEILKKRKLWDKYKEMYWQWRVGGYLWFYDNLSEEMKAEYLSIFYKDIRCEMESETYLNLRLSDKEKELCKIAKSSFEEFKVYIETDDLVWEQTQQKMSVLTPEIDTVIFGMGNMGLLVNCYLEQKGMPAAAGIDNASWKWNKSDNGILILSPEEGTRKYPDAVYIISNAIHENEMKEQLQALGIKDEKIIICSHYDLFLKKMLVKKIREERHD